MRVRWGKKIERQRGEERSGGKEEDRGRGRERVSRVSLNSPPTHTTAHIVYLHV